MAESQEPYNVVLEIGEENGVKSVSNNVVIGTNDIDVYYGCKEPANDQGDMAFNPTTGFPDISKEGYSGNYIGNYWGIGDLGLGCSQTEIQPNLSGIAYEPTSSSKLIMFNLGVPPGAGNPQFYRLEPWSFGNGLHRPYNGVQQGRQGTWSVQGRCLYIKRTLGSTLTMCFDVVDSYGSDMLIVKGNGGDQLDDYSQIDNTWHVGNQNFNHENYEWYVSPYVHSGKWDSSGNNLTWNGERQSKIMSYRGKQFSGSGQNVEINECFYNEGYLGLRSSDFREAIDGGAFDDGQPGVNDGLHSWEIKITVASITNAKIELFEGTPTIPAITSGLSNGFEITTAGSYTVCLSALPHSAVWRGKNNAGAFALSDTGMEKVKGSPTPEFADMMDGQLTLLNITTIDNGMSSSAVIEKIELKRKEPDIRRESEDIFGSTVNYDVPDYKWNYLEVTESEGVPLSLNFSVGDIGDISKRTAGYSKTFMLPASAHNNAIITPMLAVNSQKSTIGWQRGRVKANGVHIFEGLLRIEEGNTANGGFYKCHIVEDTIDWTEDLGESTLCDVFMLGDDGDNGWTSPTKTKGSFEVQDSWLHSKPFDTFSPGGHHVPAQPWFWGLAQYGEWYFKSIGAAGKEFKHNAQDFHPVVYTKVLVDRIFESIGYTVQSRFLNSTTAHLLCHPFGAGEDYLVSNNIFGAGGDYYGKAKTSGSYQSSDLLGTSNFESGGYIPANINGNGWDRTWYPSINVQSDVSNSFTGNGGTNSAFGSSNHGYVIPFDGDWKFALAGVIDVSYSTFGDGGAVDVEFLRNGVVEGYIWPGDLPGLTDHGQYAFSGSVTIVNANAGDVLSFRIRAETYMWCCKYWVRADDLEALVYPLATGAVPSIAMNNSKILTCDTKQIDVLKGLTDMFNLQWKADAINKTIHIEPYNDFFGSGATLDWTEKIDLSKWNDKFIVEELAKEIVFRYERDSQDDLIEVVDRWREANGKGEYQTHIEIQSERFRKKTVELGTGEFKVSVSTNAYGLQPNPSQHTNGDYGWGDLAWTDPQINKANPLMPIYWMSDGGSINGIARPDRVQFPQMKLRIVNNYSLLNGHHNEQSYDANNRSVHKCSSYKWENDQGNTSTLDEYPYMDWKNGWKQGIDTDPYCLSWNNFDDTKGKESLGLFEKYWRVAYEKMNGGSVLRTAFMNLTPIDIATFDFRDLIHIRIDQVSTYWTVNKIVDYQPNKSVLTRVELLEYKQAVDFAREYSGESKKRKVDLTKEVTSEPKKSLKRDGGFALQNDTNNSAQGKGVALGTGVVASDNQTVIGKYNNPNSTDIFQVGIGTSDDDRRTAFSIDKDGCVKVGGGEIYVEETDGTIHDLIVKKPSYKIAETIINENGDVSIRAIDFSDTDIEKLYSTRETEEEARTVAKGIKDRGNQY